MTFPPDFLWGAATAAYQIEGAADTDGKGPGIWDTFTHAENTIRNGDNGDIACDHYHRWREDIALMREIGLQAYRFSVSWPRVLPKGRGQANAKGLDFYDALVDGLLEASIEPWLTLYHWNPPQALQDAGGWLSRETTDAFADYAELLATRLGDRVRNWITLNEPQVVTHMGHFLGTHAPGLNLPISKCLQVAHNQLLAHGKAVRTLRATLDENAKIGIAPASATACWPATQAPQDIQAACHYAFAVNSKDIWNLSWYLDPICLGHYPDQGLKAYGKACDLLPLEDLALISTPIDFIGVNYYSGAAVRATQQGQPEKIAFPPGQALSHFDWPVTPEILRWHPRFVNERYGLPVYITENGMASHDWPDLDGHIHDPQRCDFLHRYLLALGQGIAEGTDVRGYFHWSLLDNFEWAEGYSRRFGLVHVDFESGHRTLKDSAGQYREIIKRNTLPSQV